MRVSRIQIHNIIGVQSLDIEPGRVVEISGNNGVGKTSVIEGLQSLFNKGTYAELRREGEDKALVGISVTDGEDVITLKRRITPSTSKRELAINGEVQKELQATVDLMFDAFSVNPIEFVTAKPEQRKQWLLSSIPFKVTLEDFQRHNIPVDSVPEGSGFEILQQVHKYLYEARHGANQLESQLRATVARLESSIPAVSVEDVQAKLAAAQSKVEQATVDVSLYRQNIQRALEGAIAETMATCAAKTDVIKEQIEELDAQIAAKRVEIMNLVSERDNEIADIRLTAANDNGMEKAKEALAKAEADRAAVAAEVTAHQRAEGVRSEYALQVAQHEKAKAKAKAMQSAMDSLEVLKSELYSMLPIKNLEMKDGEFYYCGNPLKTQNTATLLALAIKIAIARCVGKVRLICIDGCECLDDRHLAWLRDTAVKEDLQFIITRVERKAGAPFTVEVS